jgi:hypothetical protein
VTQIVGSGGRIFAMKFPSSPSGRQEVIIVHDNREGQDPPRGAYRFQNPAEWQRTAMYMPEVVEVQLTVEQWNAIYRLSERWCYDNPSFSEVQEGEPFYDVGTDCKRVVSKNRFKIPPDELPPELVMLLEAVPSALEQDEEAE